MAYQPLLDPSQLPPLGPLPEDLRFDMKMLVAGQLGAEGDLATDVAAFANTAGGILLIGAHEHPRNSGILAAYVPMTFADAQAVAKQLAKALRLCSPKPIAEAKPIALPARSADHVVAINCDAYGAPPIGVALPNQGGGEKWWAFPVRRGCDTHNLRPEELSTIMEPRLRRVTLLLEAIPKSAPTRLSIATFHSSTGQARSYFIVSLDSARASMRLRSTQDPNEVVIPLDAVSMVWREPDAERFHVSLLGSVVETSTRELQFQP